MAAAAPLPARRRVSASRGRAPARPIDAETREALRSRAFAPADTVIAEMRHGPRLVVVLALVTCSTWLAAGRVPASAADADTPRVRLRRVARVLAGTAIAARA